MPFLVLQLWLGVRVLRWARAFFIWRSACAISLVLAIWVAQFLVWGVVV
jgi:hypothetical protein